MRAIECIAVAVAGHLDADRRLALLDGVPRRLVDDAKLRKLDDLPLVARVRAGDALSGLWVLDIGAAVPFETAGVECIIENAGSAFGLAADGGVAPWPSIGTGDALIVEAPGDRAGRQAVGELGEDAPHDHRLGLIDPTLAAAGLLVGGLHHVVAIGLAARHLAEEGPAELAAPGLVAQIGEIELRHGAEEANMQRRDLAAAGDREQLDPGEAQAVIKVGDVGELATEAIERFDYHHVELP